MQLRWGDYDSHDVERYTRAKFLDYTTDNMVRGTANCCSCAGLWGCGGTAGSVCLQQPVGWLWPGSAAA